MYRFITTLIALFFPLTASACTLEMKSTPFNDHTSSSHKETRHLDKHKDFLDSENTDTLSSEKAVLEPTNKIFSRNKLKNKVGKRPKNVIMMIGDGMGLGHMEIARLFEYGKKGRLFMETLPNVALVHTYSANNIVTDSAAAGTALATGMKTKNEMIGVRADGEETDSILDKFKKDGKKVGVVSTNTVTDATPAAFTASVANRWSGQDEIARQQLKNKIDVLLGGGAEHFSPKKQNGVDLVNKFKQQGYTYVTDKNELMEAKGDKLLGLFHPSYMSFKMDRNELNSNEPLLPDMTEKAIDILNKDKKGFFLMVEGARIDQASHAADLNSIWKETIEFDQAVKTAVKWAKVNKNTLVIVLADHETMGISATEAMDIDQLKKIRVSNEYMAGKLEKERGSEEFTSESIRQVFKKYAHIDLSDEEINTFNEQIKNLNGKVYSKQRVGWQIGSMIATHYHAGVVDSVTRSLSSTGGHTANLIPIFAYGDGSEVFEGVLDNSEVPKLIAKLMDYSL